MLNKGEKFGVRAEEPKPGNKMVKMRMVSFGSKNSLPVFSDGLLSNEKIVEWMGISEEELLSAFEGLIGKGWAHIEEDGQTKTVVLHMERRYVEKSNN